ncbi:MAG: hypothetical protein ACE5K4_08865 [Candidatus Hydrothermarchaeota archaeon]
MRIVFFLLIILTISTGCSFVLIDNKTEIRLFLKNKNFSIVYGEKSPLEDQKTAEIILKQLTAIGKNAMINNPRYGNIIVVGGPVVNSLARDFNINNTYPGFGNGIITTKKEKLLVAGSDREGTMKAGIKLLKIMRFIKKTEKFIPKSIDNYFLWIKNSTSPPYCYEHVKALYTSSLGVPSNLILTVFYNLTDADAWFEKYKDRLKERLEYRDVVYNETSEGIEYRLNDERYYVWKRENIVFEIKVFSKKDPFYSKYKKYSDQFFNFSKNSSR